jgi:hypothetical protein
MDFVTTAHDDKRTIKLPNSNGLKEKGVNASIVDLLSYWSIIRTTRKRMMLILDNYTSLLFLYKREIVVVTPVWSCGAEFRGHPETSYIT